MLSEEIVYYNWILALLIFVYSRFAIPWFLRRSHENIRKFVDSVSLPQVDNETLREIKNAKIQARLVQERDDKLLWITILVGFIEMLIFVAFSIFLFKEKNITNFDQIKYLGLFLGGWLGVKILSTHRPWSNYIAGKAYYHVSLMGTIFNVASALFIALLVWKSF